jgi:hypothetical protein
MDRLVARLNIEHLREMLASESDPKKRETLTRLLQEEEKKLAEASEKAKKSG